LPGYAPQKLGQGLAHGIHGNKTGNRMVDVHVQAGIAGNGKEQLPRRHVADRHVIDFRLFGSQGKRQHKGPSDGQGNVAVHPAGRRSKMRVRRSHGPWAAAADQQDAGKEGRENDVRHA